jgi:hypothetical protein
VLSVKISLSKGGRQMRKFSGEAVEGYLVG